MRDDTANWPAPVADGLTWQTDGIALRHLPLTRQTLVSGPDVLAAFPDAAGWPTPAATGASYAVALRRDRLLLVNDDTLHPSWDAQQHRAVTDMSGGLMVFELSGARASDLLLRGAEMTASRSTLRLWAGLEVILYTHGTEPTPAVRIHVERARAETLVETLQRRAGAMLRHGDQVQ